MSEREEALRLAEQFHEAYEQLAPSFGYTTRVETRTFDPYSANGQLMVEVCSRLLANSRLARAQPHSRQEGEISERPAGGASNADSGSPPPQQEPVARAYWLIEKGSPAVYFVSEHYGALSWGDAEDALKFPDETMAKSFIDNTVLGVEADGLRICEHVFGCAPPPAQAVPDGFVELSKVVRLIELISADWKDAGMQQKQYAAEYLRDQIRGMLSAAPHPATKREGE